VLARLRADEKVRAVVFRSGKPDSFIAGADIEEFRRLQAQADLEILSRGGQEMLQRLADFPKPIIAAIDVLEREGMLGKLKLLHFHIGSQITNSWACCPEPAVASGSPSSSGSGPPSTSFWRGRACRVPRR